MLSMLSMLGKNVRINTYWNVFLWKQVSTFHANCLETVCMKCQILFSRLNKKNINLSSADVASQMVMFLCHFWQWEQESEEVLISSFFSIKSSIFLKNRHFIIQERFNKLIYGINTIIKMWHLSAYKISVSLLFLKWNDFFYIISELMLPTLIQRYHKKSFHFWSSSKMRD